LRRQPEIGQLQISFPAEQHILGLDVTMGDAFAVTPTNGARELGEVEMGHILADTFVGFDFVEQIAAFGQLEGQPDPGGILTMGQVFDDILVRGDMLVEGQLDLELLRPQSASSEGMFFVDELDGDDGGGGGERDCFADSAELVTGR
jgi:hypothetical protein